MRLQKRLSNYLCRAGIIVAIAALPASWALVPKGAGTPGTAVLAAAQGAPLNINTATVDQLKALPGIGDAYAKRIVAGRPYSSKSQLVSKGILPRAAYEKVQSMIIASHPKK